MERMTKEEAVSLTKRMKAAADEIDNAIARLGITQLEAGSELWPEEVGDLADALRHLAFKATGGAEYLDALGRYLAPEEK